MVSLPKETIRPCSNWPQPGQWVVTHQVRKRLAFKERCLSEQSTGSTLVECLSWKVLEANSVAQKGSRWQECAAIAIHALLVCI